MPLRVSNACEKNVFPQDLASPITIPANQSIVVLADISAIQGEWAGRYIQNVGANDCYYAFGHDCSSVAFNGILSKPGTVNSDGFGSGQQLDASNHGAEVTVYSRGGTTIAVTLLVRNDMQIASFTKPVI